MGNRFWWGYAAFFAFVFPLFFSYTATFPSTATMATIALALGFVGWVIFIIWTYKQTIRLPKKMQEKIQVLQRSGHLEKGRIIEKTLFNRRKNQTEEIEILVQFKNLNNTFVTHYFQFVDSQPHKNRFEEGNSIQLRLNTNGQSPAVIIQETQVKFSPKSGIIILVFLVFYMMVTFAAHYYFFSNGTGWRFLSLLHPWVITPFWALIIFGGFSKLIHTLKGKNTKQEEQLLLYGKSATAIIQRADETGTYINEQPQIKFVLKFSDDKSVSHTVSFKKVIPLTQLHRYHTGSQNILYLPDNPQTVMFEG